MNSSNAIYRDEAERQRVADWMKQAGVSLTRPSAQILDHPAKRRPLGLAPVLDDNERAAGRDETDTPGYREAKRLVGESLASLSAEVRQHPATIEDVFEGLELPLAIQMDDAAAISRSFKELRADIAELKAAHRNEIAELKLALVEARCEIREMKVIQENARTLSRGEQGIAGPRGIPGSQGARGERGERGETGSAAPMIAAWEPRVEQFQLVPVLATGERGPPISLRPFFESYDAATEGEDEE